MARAGTRQFKAVDQIDGVVAVLDLIREDGVSTRPELSRLSGLGRAVITDRLALLTSVGLIGDGDFGVSTGGRAPRELYFRASAGYVLSAALGATTIHVALSDLEGLLCAEIGVAADITSGPTAILQRVDELFRSLLAEHPVDVWGIGVGVPGPVEFSTGRPVAPPIMPGWDDFDIRSFFASRFNAPVWVDNDVNVMAFGELRRGRARGVDDVVFIKVGTGIGAGLVSGGRLHRGSQGCAGDIGHIAVIDSAVVCRCGNLGCLEAVAGGVALVREGYEAAHSGRSAVLAELVSDGRPLRPMDIVSSAARGDPVSVELLNASADHVGNAVARLVNFFNPSMIVMGGEVAAHNDAYLARVRRHVIDRSPPLATRSLDIITSGLGPRAGVVGAAFTVIERLLSAPLLAHWIDKHPSLLVGRENTG